MGYTPSFTPQYENGWEDLPSETSPITAEALNAYDDAIENIEEYLASDESQSNLADAYSAIETYSEGDYRIHNGTLYKCLEDIDTPEEWDSTKWESCLITDEMATSGGTTVIANPEGTATATLNKLQVEETIYSVEGGGGNANIWTGTQAELEEVFDELEEGTQINITDDEQEVVEGGTIYSEEEQVIGLWKDNRPLYQKSYVVTSSISVTSSWTNTGITLPNEVDRIINGEVYRNTSTGLFSASFNISSHALRIRFASSETLDANSIITIQYTKSTDAPLDVVVGKSTMYIASSDCYSTEEKEIGCWTDGKPIYQKTIDFGALPNNASKSVAHGIANIEEVVDYECLAYSTSNGYHLAIPYVNKTNPNLYNIQFDIDATNINIVTSADRTTYDICRVTLKYTKTTDTAGSGQYTPANGKAVHYSTDEQVIGTWIDGSTVYRRCYTLNTETGSFNANTWKEIPEIDTSNMRMALRVVGIPYDPSLPTVFVNYPLSGSTNRNAFNNHFAIMHYRNSAVNFTVGSIIIVEYTKLND